LDSYPYDSACYFLVHGDGVNCDVDTMIPNYIPDQTISANGIVYLLSRDNARVYRWSVPDGAYINPLVVGLDKGKTIEPPYRIADSAAHDRLYLTYSEGIIQYINLQGDLSEKAFAKTAFAVGGLAAVGDYILVADTFSLNTNRYVFDANGNLTDNKGWGSIFEHYAWSPIQSKMYYLAGTSSRSLLYMEIEQNTGLIVDSGSIASASGPVNFRTPISLSTDEAQIILGSGDIINTLNQASDTSLDKVFADVLWLNQQIITVDIYGGTSQVKIWDKDSLQYSDESIFDGRPIALIPNGEDVILVHSSAETVTFSNVLVGNQAEPPN